MNDLRELWYAVAPDLQLSVPFHLRDCAKMVFRVGSHSHGTHIPVEDEHGVDDVDLMVICVPPPEYKLGLKNWEHAEYKHGRWDVVFYDWGKWLHMLRKSNPNVLGCLWLEPEDTLSLTSPFGDAFWPWVTLRQGRDRLLSKQMAPAFLGYAKGQLYKMTHHAHQGYMGEKRKTLVSKYGYDVKNAAHLIRLMRMACEAFETGELVVRRPDAEELIQIKSGRWTLQEVFEETDRLFDRAQTSITKSLLQEYPDDKFIQNVMLDGYSTAWAWKL